jgi:nitrite reductase/ring-hydroxylating ferredoxin subunit
MTSDKTDGVSVGYELEYVCEVSDLGNNEMRRHVAGDGRAVAICRVRDQFFGVDDRCTHEKAWLTDGYLDEDYVIECPLHGGSFDVRTGQPETFPCTVAVRTHQVVVDGDQVLLGSAEQS